MKPHSAQAFIEPKAGVGLRSSHYAEILENLPKIPWLEVHSENYFKGGAAFENLLLVREHYPVSLHCIGISLGSVAGPSQEHLSQLKNLAAAVEPGLISDHVSWSEVNGKYLNDLLPLPYTEESLDILCRNISITQDFLGRRILIENPSAYVKFADSVIPEWEYITEAAKRTGCGILLDVNNIYVSARNGIIGDGLSAATRYLEYVPPDLVEEIHLAGYHVNRYGEQEILIDNHGARVYPEVWELFRQAIEIMGRKPVLIEWDSDVPPISVLMEEAEKAEIALERASSCAMAA